MASTLLGIDLGSYSVKVARLEAGFRSVTLLSLYELRVSEATPLAPVISEDSATHSGSLARAGRSAADSHSMSGETSLTSEAGGPSLLSAASPPRDSLLRRQMKALDTLLAEIAPKNASVALGLSDELTLRVVDLPLSDPKKVAATLPFELSGQLMAELDDQIVDQTMVRINPATAGGGEASSQWVAAAVPREDVRQHLRALLGRGLDARLVGSTALATAALFFATASRRRPKDAPPVEGEPTPPPLPALVIDLGHSNTHICAVAPHPTRPGQVVVPFVRSVARGGLQLTLAVARAHDLHYTRAEMLKHEYGLDEQADPKTAKAIREALRPLIRELRQTLSAYSARQSERPKAIFLCGGGSELRGIYDLLQSELEIEVMPLVPPHNSPWFGNRDKDAQKSLVLSSSMSLDSATLHRARMPAFALLRRFHACAPAVGLALSLFQPSPQVNFRKGDLAFRTDYAFLREKAPYLAAFSIALLLCASGWIYATLHVLQKESERLRLRLITETTNLFGEARTDGDAVLAELQAALREDKSSEKRIPQVSAFDLLEDISHAAPPSTGSATANLDVMELHIRPKKVELKATAASAQYVEDFAAALGKLGCVKSVQKGKVLTVKNSGPDGKPIDVKQFSLELATTCP